MKKYIFNKFIKANKKYYFENNRKEKDNLRNILVTSVTDDILMNVILLRFSKVISNIENSEIIFIPHVKTSSKTKRLTQSFRLKYYFDHFKTGLAVFLANLIKILKTLFNISRGGDLESLKVDNVNLGKHIYDYILRQRKIYTINNLDFRMKLSVLYGLYYYYLLDYLIRKYQPAATISLDNVYLEGIVFEVSKKYNLRCYTGFDINLMTLHLYRDTLSYSKHCRTPDNYILKQDFLLNLKDEVEQFLKTRFSGLQNQHDAKRSFSKDKILLSKHDLIQNYNLDEEKPIILVLPHVFADAPHAYPEVFYKDYYVWFKETLKILNSLNDCNIIVKEHPSAILYGEDGLVGRLLEELGLSKVKLISNTINSFSLMNIVDTMVTCGGTSGMEYSYNGVSVIIASKPPYYNFGFVHYANTKEQYEELLRNHKILGRPKKKDRLNAGYVLYIINHFYGISKNKLGIYDYVVNMGEPIDNEKFLDSISDKTSIKKFEVELEKQIRFMLDHDLSNLYDYNKLNNFLTLSQY